jgi:phospholipase C
MSSRVKSRRHFLRVAARAASAAAAYSVFPPAIRMALAIPAAIRTGTIRDVRHVVVLMQENRSFDHYFGTLRGVRGFADRHPIPLPGGKLVWNQSDGEKEILPYHLDTRITSAIRVPVTPHSFADAQAAWNQGRFGFWPKYKTAYSMGHYRRDDIPFQFALADAFTICDAYHCSVTTGTDPNRIVFWSGSNFNPELRARGENCTDTDSEPDNLRCWIEGGLPEPGYTYAGSAFRWPTVPEVLARAGIRWRIYQDPNDNWTGAMHGCLAFESFRTARPGSSLHRNGMSHWSLEDLANDVKHGALPQVSWVLPPKLWSEHPLPSSPLQGAEFTARILSALTANPEVWSRTVFFLTFDENDGLFDHMPPPVPPSYDADGRLAGKSTLDLRGQYFSDPERKHLARDDIVSGSVRPWGLGPRVPMYVISPWSRGGWVNSQVFDHTSVSQFLEKRFNIHIPAISPWHRVVCGDLTTALDFASPNNGSFPELPDMGGSAAVIAAHSRRPKPVPPRTAEPLFQELGIRGSRALPYALHVHACVNANRQTLALMFRNSGQAGAVFHVYDRLHLDRIPRRYTIEAGRMLTDEWQMDGDAGRYELWVCAPNGFVREFTGALSRTSRTNPEIELKFDVPARSLRAIATNTGTVEALLTVRANAYRTDGPWQLTVPRGKRAEHAWSLATSHCWYDFTVTGENFARRFSGRLETGAPGTSDPAV